jgi:SAM-dependent methyltransferase
MTGTDRARWDKIYREMGDVPFPPPDPLLFEHTPPITGTAEHRALDLAAGLGQNGLWLAAQGYLVDLMDISRIALLKAQAEAGKRGLHNINLYPVDVDKYEFKTELYDLVCVFRYLNRDLFSTIRQSVKPNGRVIYETFNIYYLKLMPDFNPAYLLEIGELSGYFADWKIIFQQEDTYLSRIVAVKS